METFMSDLFPDSRELRIEADDASLFARVGGEGPPLLLLHGFPQSHAMWHAVYPALAARFTCVMPDLRGYGASSCPPGEPRNLAYSKRRMAQDAVAVMASLGHERFLAVGHDRGGRVTYRLALDRPEAVKAIALLDIVPTAAMWRSMGATLAMKTYHWMMLAQPSPLPEMLLSGDPAGFLDFTLASWTRNRDLSAFDPRALAAYRAAWAQAERRRAACDDYRAGATIDRELDEDDLAAGRRIACPTLALWGHAGIPSAASSPLDVWRTWCETVEGQGIDSGHFVAEENPQATLDALMPFLARHADA
jgi:haloacetate dehalogenase